MKLYHIIILFLLMISITGCTPKLTVKSLYPSKIPDEKFYSIHIREFLNDSINQSSKLEQEIVNKIIDNKRVFKVTDEHNAEVIIEGEIVESSLYYNIFYKRDIDYTRCTYYKYDEKSKKQYCIKYYVKIKPCEDRQYKLITKIKLVNSNNKSLLFSKIYEKTREIQKCYDNFYPYYSFSTDKKRVNSILASQIASDVTYDISPHYVYFDVEIIDELDETKSKYTKEQKEKFSKIIKQIKRKSLLTANEELKKLNFRLKEKSWEVQYNLALTYEGLHKLYQANKLYKEAKLKVSKLDNLELINRAILRTQKNLEEKIKAKSQLP